MFVGLAVLAVIGFTGYKVNSSKPKELSSTTVFKSQKTVAKTNGSLTPTEQSNVTTVTPTTQTTQPKASTNTANTTNSRSTPGQTPTPQKRVISFTKGGGGQQGDVMHMSANLSESQQGTCTYQFSLDGNVRVEQTSSVTNANQCASDVPVSKFPKSSTYSFVLSFVSSDGLVSATQAPYDITVN